jgi:outer membrane usher protein
LLAARAASAAPRMPIAGPAQPAKVDHPAAAPVAPQSGSARGAPPSAPPPSPAKPASETVRLNTTGRTMTIVVSAKDGATYLGDVDAQIMPDDTILVSLPEIIQFLTPRLAPARLADLRQVENVGGFALLSAFEKHGFPMRFDKRTFELVITIATADRALRTIELADLDRAVIGDFAAPSSFSGYLNLRGSTDYVFTGGGKGLVDPFFLADSAIRIAPVVIEGEASWNGLAKNFTRTGTRAVYDDQKRLVRWTAGDLEPQNRGFQGVLNMAGIGISRSYALLEPQRNIAPRGGRTFSISREATVEAFVNGRSVRTLRLQPGTYNVSDFPFAQGGNDVQLVIVDDTGQRETISFSTFIERTQLAPGLSEFDFNIGMLSRQTQGISYTSDPAVTGYYRRGISDNLTLGGNFQYARKGYMGGAEFVLGTSIGTVGGDVAVSHLPGSGLGWAGNFSLERITQGVHGSSSLLAAIEVRSRRFGAVGQLASDNPYNYNVSLSYNRSLGEQSFAGVQLRYAHGRGGIIDERSVRVNYGRRIGRFTNVTIDAEWSKGVRGDDKSFRISLVRRFGSRTSARAEYDTQDDRARFGVQSSGGYGIGAWSAGGNLDVGGDAVAFNGAANYTANRADLGMAYTASYSPDSKSITDQRASFRFGSSLAFADGTFAVGRPISDSFAIFRPYKGGKGTGIVVDPAEESEQARSGVMGPALYGELTSYSPSTLTYDVPDAPPGMDLGTGALRSLAPYHSGYVVVVGSDYNVMVVGTLTAQGEPVSLQVGHAIEVGGEHRSVELFTNRQGRFAAAGLRPGKWRIEIGAAPPLVYDLVIPDDAPGVFRVGDLGQTDEK